MLRTLRTRRRPRYGAQVCAIIAALLLLLSVSILHSRLKLAPQSPHHFPHAVEFTQDSLDDLDVIVANPLLDDSENHGLPNNRDDPIDELDDVEDEQAKATDEEEILRGLEDDSESDLLGLGFRGGGIGNKNKRFGYSGSGYYWDHIGGVMRRAFDKHVVDDSWEDSLNFGSVDRSREAFDSDDLPVSDDVRAKLDGIKGIEDALLLRKDSKLSDGWASWFEKKGDFLRRDKMFRSNLEALNPLNNPLLQDPDGIGLTFLSKGDKIMQKNLLNEMRKKPFGVERGRGLGKRVNVQDVGVRRFDIRSRNEVKGVERRTLDHNGSGSINDKNILSSPKHLRRGNVDHGSSHASNDMALKLDNEAAKDVDSSNIEFGQQIDRNNLKAERQIKSELEDHIYADGKRWGYFPGLASDLSFSDFMEEFFKKGKCSMRVFMVWNSPPWMYSVRLQRGLESLLYHHPDACVVVFSETIELDFFEGFVKDGFKVAVAMPNLDELLKDTPTHVFASVWFEWKKTKYYPIHSSELVRLASLYRYGGLYLDSDIIVLKSLSSLSNSIGLEDEPVKSSFNGAVMAFSANSPFIMECLREFYSSYDDTLLRGNGADLLTRTVKKFLTKENHSDKRREVKVQPSSMFFPINSEDITRYFAAPADDTERAKQHILLLKILDGSYTFHFWNGLTSALVPEPDSLVAKLLNRHCIRCHDLL